jgi:hypothetical protein
MDMPNVSETGTFQYHIFECPLQVQAGECILHFLRCQARQVYAAARAPTLDGIRLLGKHSSSPPSESLATHQSDVRETEVYGVHAHLASVVTVY